LPGKPSAGFVCAMEDVLDVYHRPYDPHRPQVCMDETSKQLVGEVRAPLPPRPGRPERFDTHYVRNGVANLFMVFEPLTGRRHVEVTERHTRSDWAQLMKDLVDIHYPRARQIVLVCDNLNTHEKASLYEAFPPDEAKRIADKLDIHYTPKHASWLNVAECELSVLARQCLDRRIPHAPALKREVTAWTENRNNIAEPLNWRFTIKDARIKMRRLYPAVAT
jgi:hypothetical protein